MNRDDLKFWIALKSISGIGSVNFQSLLDQFGSAPAVFDASVPDLKSVEGISKETASAIADFNSWKKIKEELELIHKYNVNIITYQDELYPQKLLNIYDLPPYVYVMGNLKKMTLILPLSDRARLAPTANTRQKKSAANSP